MIILYFMSELRFPVFAALRYNIVYCDTKHCCNVQKAVHVLKEVSPYIGLRRIGGVAPCFLNLRHSWLLGVDFTQKGRFATSRNSPSVSTRLTGNWVVLEEKCTKLKNLKNTLRA
jgi:hypothetical protein